MDKSLFGIANFDVYVVVGILVVFGLMEVFAGYLKSSKRESGDWIQEVGSFFVLSVLIKPGIILAVLGLGVWLAPSFQYVWADWNLAIMLVFFLLIDDVLQYWYHRSAHEYEWLWRLHRPHHQAEEMGFFVSYRNAALYYLLMPNIWWIGLLTFLGGAKAIAIGLILKQLVIIGSHSPTKWDRVLYKYPWLNPLATLVERIIITPAFHFAHHGRSMQDGISDPNGNYGNMFSIWDQLFGTAKFTRQYPTELGLQKPTNDHWSAQYLYPAITSEDTNSNIARGFTKEDTTVSAPSLIQLEPGTYLWCQCGKSKQQPFCDGTHHGSKHKPLVFEVKRAGKVRLCNCKKTGEGPFCDDSHLA